MYQSYENNKAISWLGVRLTTAEWVESVLALPSVDKNSGYIYPVIDIGMMNGAI